MALAGDRPSAPTSLTERPFPPTAGIASLDIPSYSPGSAAVDAKPSSRRGSFLGSLMRGQGTSAKHSVGFLSGTDLTADSSKPPASPVGPVAPKEKSVQSLFQG